MTSAQTFPASAPPKFASIGSPYFGIMLAVMAVVLILSNIGASKGVALGPIVTDGGFFRAKGAVEVLHHALHADPGFAQAEDGVVTVDGAVRRLADGWGYFELNLDTLFARAEDLPLYEDVITFPGVKQDLAFVVDEAVAAGDLEAAAREAAGPELRELRAFDVYRGDQAGPGKKSVAFHAVFQSPDRTLTDADAARLRERIARALEARFDAHLRA